MITNILQYLERNACRFSDKIALNDDKHQVTFSQWYDMALRIGSAIGEHGEMRRPVVVFVDRRIEPLVAFLGVVASGNFYVPIDCSTPKERMKHIIDVLNPLAAITISPADDVLLDSAGYAGRRYRYEVARTHEIKSELLSHVQDTLIDMDPVYAIFTSGSTGLPKAVVIPHRGMIDMGNWLSSRFDVTCDDVIGNQSPFYFDGSVKDILMCLKGGATLHIIPKKFFSFPKLLMKFLNEKKVTSIWWATSAIVLAANSGILEVDPPRFVKIVTFGGEAIQPKQLNCWRRALPDATFVNLYGPTEASVDSTYFILNREFADDEVIPIGNHCENKNVLVLTSDGRLAGIGDEGELCVRGSGVALGYYNNAERSLISFVQNPLHNLYEDRIYRTGDIVKWNQNGELIFVSRKDFQIKHMGYRIELGEIEAAVDALPSVTAAACVYDNTQEQIVLFYVTKDGAPIDMQIALKDRLPKYMSPGVVCLLENMPLNANGKIDRVTLKNNYEMGVYNE